MSVAATTPSVANATGEFRAWLPWPPQEGSASQLSLVAVGIGLAIVGAITSGLGMNLMRASSRHESEHPLYCRRRFLLGVAMACCINAVLDSVAFAVAPLSVIAPIGGLTIVSSTVAAHLGCCDEREFVTRHQALPILLIVIGVAVVSVYGPRPVPSFDVIELLRNLVRPEFLLYSAATAATLALTHIGLHMKWMRTDWIGTTICTAVASGMCSGITQVLLKLMAICIARFMATGFVPWGQPLFFLAATELATVALLLLRSMNVCLSSAPLCVAASLYQTNVILWTIVASNAFYDDLQEVHSTQMRWFMGGAMLVLSGLTSLVGMQPQTTQVTLERVPKHEPITKTGDARALSPVVETVSERDGTCDGEGGAEDGEAQAERGGTVPTASEP